MSLTLCTDTFITLADAETYMAKRLGASKFWHKERTDQDTKEAALATAYRSLVGCGQFSLPTTAGGITQPVKDAQCEMALFLLQHQEDMDGRLGLQAQGVRQAGIVQESYGGAELGAFPIPPLVAGLLDAFRTGGQHLAAVDLARDDDEDV